MQFLAIPSFVFFLAALSSAASSNVRYCDGIFQLTNRTDESEKTCKWFSPHIVEEHLPCNTSTNEGGLTCEGECVSFGDWCVKGTTNPTVCGYHLQNPAICRNKTFWGTQECPEMSLGRCTGWWPGQCQGEDGCRDQSYQDNNNDDNISDNNTCLAGDKIINMTQEFMTCQDKYNSNLLICAKTCNRVFDGCKDDSDEKDCVPVVSNITLGLVVAFLILITIIGAEITLWALKVKSSQKDPQNVPSKRESTEMKILLNEDGTPKRGEIQKWLWFGSQTSLKDSEVLQEIAAHMDKLFDMLLDPGNWVFGELQFATCSTFASPRWTTGENIGFNNQKMGKIKVLYNNFRKMIPDCQAFNVRKCDCPRCMCFRFFLFAVPNKSPEKPRKQFEKLPHYVFDLVYNKLEVDFLQEYTSHTEDVDISIKYALGNRESGLFYGNVFPYLHVPSLILKMIQFNGAWIEDIESFIRNIPHIMSISYFVCVILAIVGFYVDFIKDVLIADHVTFLYTNFWDFKSQIVIILWATIFVNQTVIGVMIVIRGPTDLFNFKVCSAWKRCLIRVMFLILSPLSPTLLLYMNARMAMKINDLEETLEKEVQVFHPPKIYYSAMDNLRLYHSREQLVERKRKMESVIGTSYIIGVIYENTPQILVQFLIVLLSLSAITLPGLTGIEAVWDTRNENDNIGSVFFFFSIVWSLFSIITSLVSTFLYQKEYSVGDLGKILIFFLMFIGTSIRLFCVILYATPFLGLFNLLLHYQIEQTISYSPELLAEMENNPNPSPDLHWYLPMAKTQALVVFIFIPLVHAVVVLIYKSVCVDHFKLEKVSPSSASGTKDSPHCLLIIYNRFIHAFSSLLGPTLWRDWDFPIKTTRQEYQNLWRKSVREYLHMSILFLVENLILLVPLLYTCTRVLQHHATLQYPLQEEQVVVRNCYWFLASPLIVLVLSCLHFYLFIVYNKYGHPWSILLSEKNQEEQSAENVETS